MSVDEDIIREIEKLKKAVKVPLTLTPLYTILNQNSPAILTADKNDYDIGAYDHLLMSSDALRTVTGFLGGAAGRLLWVTNQGVNNIAFTHNNAGSAVGNRIVTYTGATVTVAAAHSTVFIYNGVALNWRLLWYI